MEDIYSWCNYCSIISHCAVYLKTDIQKGIVKYVHWSNLIV